MTDVSITINNGGDRIQICYKFEPILSIDVGTDWNLQEDKYVLHRWIASDFSYIDTELYYRPDDDDYNEPSYVCKISGVDEI